jgi:hypothetical protein
MSLIEGLIKSAKLAKQGKKVVVEAKPFFSAVDKAALDLQRAKGTGKEFMTELKKTKGIKPAEIENRKLAQIEEMPKMTKDQFIDELEKRPPVDISESVLPEGTSSIKDKYAQDYYDRDYYELGTSQREYIDNMMAKYGKDPHYYDYHLPDGENYREILLQLPHFSQAKVDELMAAEAASRRNPGNLLLAHTVDALKAEKASYGDPYIHQHFGSDNPNILAHMRVQDRLEEQPPEMRYVAFNKNSGFPSPDFATPEELDTYIKTLPANIQNSLVVKQAQVAKPPRKILHVEEIQSDWHQEGRKKGYKKEDPIAKEYQRLEEKVFGGGNYTPEEEARFYALQEQGYENKPVTGVPDAPFKKNWHELAMKRLLNYASENGYDGIAITPGAEQAKRYNIGDHIDSLDFSKNSNGTVDISGIKDRSSVIDKTMQTPEQIESLVGKEIARKIFDTTTSFGSLTGLDLQVGGEGMKGFYDKMIPDYLNTFGKKYNVQTEMGGYKLKGDPSLRGDASERLGLAGQSFADMTPEEIEAFNAKLDESNAKQLHYFKITPEMREEVKQGMPLYQQVGVPIGTGAAGAELVAPQEEEPAFAAGGAVFNTNPDMTDGGRIIQGAPFKRGGKVHVAQNSDTMFMEMSDKKPNLTKRSSGLINVKRK